MFLDFSREEEGFCIFGIEATRLEIEECLSTKTMHLTRVTSFDIIGRDFEFRYASYMSIFPKEDICLINASRDFSIGFFDCGNSANRDIRVISCQYEDSEIAFRIVAIDDSFYSDIRLFGSDDNGAIIYAIFSNMNLPRKSPIFMNNETIG